MDKGNAFIYVIALACGIFLLLLPEYTVHVSFIFWIALMVYCAWNIESRMLLMLFGFTVFVFGMSRIVIPTLYTNDYIQTSIEYSESFEQNVYDFIARACYISLLCALVGFNSIKEKRSDKYTFHIDPNSIQNKRIRNVSKYLYLISSILIIYSIYTRISFVVSYGYEESYLDYSSGLPTILSKFASTNSLYLYLFLATLPSKKEARPILVLFVLISVFSLLTGARTNFVMSLITLMVYLVLRNRITPDDLWLTRKGKIIVLSIIPVIAVLMFVVMLIRGDSSTSDISFVAMIINSVYQQGSTINVLGLSYENVERIPYKLWSFGRIIDNYGNNFLFQIMGTGHSLKSNTQDIAINGHSLANYLTYTYQTKRFFSGGGMGSSFIAESWLDFGYPGIVFFSYVYGVILAKFYAWAKRNVWKFAIAFYMVNAILYAPRASACDFIADLLSPTYLLTALLIYNYSKR